MNSTSILTQIPVDPRVGAQAAELSARPVNKYVEGAPKGAPKIQETTEDGVPLWKLKVLLNVGAGMDTVEVKFPAATQLTVGMGTALTITDLIARPIERNVYFSAGSVTSSQPVKRDN